MKPQPSPGEVGASEFAAIYEVAVDYVWASLQHMGTPAAELEDLTHDVLVKAFQDAERVIALSV